MLPPSDDQVIKEIVRQLIITGQQGGDRMAEALAQFQAMGEEMRAELRAKVGVRNLAMATLPGDVAQFHVAVNALIRLYMAAFQDKFVEQISFHQLGGTVAKGVLQTWIVDGVLVENFARVGKAPPVLIGPWQQHAAAQIGNFKQALADGVLPSSVELLCVRAAALLERGAHRSAIIEASAALETAISKKITEKLKSAGKNDAEVHALFKKHFWFAQCTDELFKLATGKPASALDPVRWKRVLDHRDAYRHAIAHNDLEPAQADTQSAVEDFSIFARAITALP